MADRSQSPSPIAIAACLAVAVALILSFWWADQLPLGLVGAGVVLILAWRYLFRSFPLITPWPEMSGVQRSLFVAILLFVFGGVALFLVGGA